MIEIVFGLVLYGIRESLPALEVEKPHTYSYLAGHFTLKAGHIGV